MLIKKQESYKKGIITSTILNIVSKGVAFINSILLVYLFGTNFNTDTYFLVISSIGFVASFLLGIISYIVIPEAMRIRVNKGAADEQAYINFFLWIFVGIGFVIALLVLIAGPFFYSLFSKFTPEQLYQNNNLLLISSILFPLNFVTNLLVFVLASHKFFTIPMVVSLINSCISILLLFVLKAHYGITAAIIAFAGSSIINLLWLLYYLKKHLHWSFFSIHFPSRKNWHNIFLMELNIIPVSFRSFVNIYMLSGLGAGIITSYNYGMQIALIPEIMIISQVSAVMGIKLNELSAQGNTEEINQLFFRVLKLLFFGLVPVAIIIFLLAPEMLQVLFMFKKNSDAASLDVIAAFMICFAVTLPTRALDTIISGIMTAQQKIRQGVVMAVSLHTSIILFTFLAVHFYGLKGFYFLIPFVYLVYIPVFFYFFTKKVLPFIRLSLWFKESALYFFLMVISATGLFLLKKYFLVQYGLFITTATLLILVIASVWFVNRLIRYQQYSFKI